METVKYDIKRGVDIYRQIDTARLARWIVTGKIRRGEVLVWRSSLSGWRKPEELEELIPFFVRWEKLGVRKIQKKLLRKPDLPQKKQIKNILIVDDEKDLCLLLNNTLTRRKYKVSIANTKKEALARIKREMPDFVFLDLRLPDGNGLKLLSCIKKLNPVALVGIISAYGSQETKEEAIRKGAFAFIDKPFTDVEILRCIKQQKEE